MLQCWFKVSVGEIIQKLYAQVRSHQCIFSREMLNETNGFSRFSNFTRTFLLIYEFVKKCDFKI